MFAFRRQYVAPKGCPNIEEVFEYYQKNALKKLPKMVSKVQSDDLDYEFDDEKPAAVKRTRSETFSGPVVSFHGSQKLSLSHQIGTQIEPAGIADDRASASSINTVIVGRQTPKRMRSSRFHQNEQYNTIAKASVHRLISEITHSISQETYKFTVASFDGLQVSFRKRIGRSY